MWLPMKIVPGETGGWQGLGFVALASLNISAMLVLVAAASEVGPERLHISYESLDVMLESADCDDQSQTLDTP